MTEYNDASIAHMTMIQGVISRLETNALTLKALAMTLATAVLAFFGSVENPDWVYPLAGCLPVLVFWYLDAKYLWLGRLFRRLYNGVRLKEVTEPFTMNIEPYQDQEQSVLRIAFSWSVGWVYSLIIITFMVVMGYHFSCG